ncbi:MAG: S8 family peptidase [Synechococcales bacterium]|nr:S8 family peptidase [Synechococcales bacterium]
MPSFGWDDVESSLPSLSLSGLGQLRQWRSPQGNPLPQSDEGVLGEPLGVSFRGDGGDRPTAILRPGRRRQSQLTDDDPLNKVRPGRFADDYQLRNVRDKQQIHLKLNSTRFDTVLQVFNADTKELLFQNDDSFNGIAQTTNSRLTFIVQPGVDYLVRVTSYGSRETGKYSLRARAFTPSVLDFSFSYGAGLVDAEAAVAAAIASPPIPATDAPEREMESWNLEQVRAPQVWQQGFTGQGTVVAVVDTGVDLNNPDLAPNIWRNLDEIPDNGIDDDNNGYADDVNGWDFTRDRPSPDDRNGHGTHVAGIVAATRNGEGVTGVAPDAQIMPVRVLDGSGRGTQFQVAKGIRYAAKNGADVINLSLGANPGTKVGRPLRRALKLAARRGVTVVIAAGNERQELGSTQSGEPAFWASTRNLGIVVGAVDETLKMADFSNPMGNPSLGNSLPNFVVAPGVRVFSLLPFTSLPFPLSGTSMAVPHVAGVIALMLSANPSLPSGEITTVLSTTSRTEGITVV